MHGPAPQPLIQGQGWQNGNDSPGEGLSDLTNLPQSRPFFSRHRLEANNGLVGAADAKRMATVCQLVWFSMEILESRKKGKSKKDRSGWVIKILRSPTADGSFQDGSVRIGARKRQLLGRGEWLQHIS